MISTDRCFSRIRSASIVGSIMMIPNVNKLCKYQILYGNCSEVFQDLCANQKVLQLMAAVILACINQAFELLRYFFRIPSFGQPLRLLRVSSKNRGFQNVCLLAITPIRRQFDTITYTQFSINNSSLNLF
jgi:hypothetical protein